MTQRYFAQGKFALNIRNSSNYHVLMRNADERTNLRAADSMNLKKEIIKANECNETKMYPYIFIDKTNHARVNGIKVYIDIFSKYKQVIMKSKRHYLITEEDFKPRFEIIDENTAHENPRSKISKSSKDTEKCSAGENSGTVGSKTEPTGKSIIKGTSRRELRRRVKQAIYRHKQRTVV